MRVHIFIVAFAICANISAETVLRELPVPFVPVCEVAGRPDITMKCVWHNFYEEHDNVKYCDYDFSQCTARQNAYCRVDARQPLNGLARTLRVELLVREPLRFTAWFEDCSGEVYLARQELAVTDKWQTVSFKVPASPAFRSGDGNRRLDLPMRLLGIGIGMPESKSKNHFLIGEIVADCDVSMLELLGEPSLSTEVFDGSPAELRIGMEHRNLFPLVDYSFELTVTDLYRQTTVMSQQGAFDPDGVYPLDLRYGSFRVDYKVRRGNRELLAWSGKTHRFLPRKMSDEPAIRKFEYEYSPAGGVFGRYETDIANQYGASWIRMSMPNWKGAEPVPGKLDFKPLFAEALRFRQANVKPVILQTLYNVPDFRKGLPPREFATLYGHYLGGAAGTLEGIADTFELGNEDNGHTKFIYTEIARHGAAAIRAAQPEAVVLNSGTAFVDVPWLRFQAERGLFDFLDAFCVHPYTNNSTASQSVSPEKGGIAALLEQLHEVADSVGGMKELWSTEFGWPNHVSDKVEHDRTDLYVRAMLLGDIAGLNRNGLYTWNRDYGVWRRPSGVAVQTFARMREGRRFAGAWREGDVWIAVYEKGGEAVAVVWTPEDGTRPLPVTAKRYTDLFGNETAAPVVSQSPVYLLEPAAGVLRKAAAAACRTAEGRYRKSGGGVKEDPAGALKAWSAASGPVAGTEQAQVGRLLDWALAKARYEIAPAREGEDGAAFFRQLRETIAERNRTRGEDMSALRYLLRLGDRLESEAECAEAVSPLQAGRIRALRKMVAEVAARLSRDGVWKQFASFGCFYGIAPDGKLTELLAFVPGEATRLTAVVSSYAGEERKLIVTPVLPKGWKSEPASTEVTVPGGESRNVDFQILCPLEVVKPVALKLAVGPAGAAKSESVFNTVEILPALSVESEVLNRPLPDAGIVLKLSNNERRGISGTLIVRDEAGNSEVGRARLAKIPAKSTAYVTVAPVADAPVDWHAGRLTAEFVLRDGRRFSIPFKVDFVHAARAEEPLRIDAKLDDWAGAFPLRLDRAEYALGSYGSGWTPEDCSATTRLMYDSRNFYFTAEVLDQTFNQLFANDQTFRQDSIQILLAPDRQSVMAQLDLALTPAGPQVYLRTFTGTMPPNPLSKRLMTEAEVAIRYQGGRCFYEAAIPWAALGREFTAIPANGRFFYAIAVNDDDAVTPRRFLERFPDTIVHGKRVNNLVEGGMEQSAVPYSGAEESGIVFRETFQADTPGSFPAGWLRRINNHPPDYLQVTESGASGEHALRVHNAFGSRPNHYSLALKKLKLTPTARYRLSADVWNAPATPQKRHLLGVCADESGNKDFRYMELAVDPGWQTGTMDFTAPPGGELFLIIRNTNRYDNVLIRNIEVREVKP